MTDAPVPVDVLRLIAARFLADKDRLQLAQTCRRWRRIAAVDVSPVLLGFHFHDSHPGFFTSPNGYATCIPEPNDEDPYRLGVLATTDPFAFVRQWLAIPNQKKSAAYRSECVSAMVLQATAWHADVMASLKLLLTCRHRDCPCLCPRVLAANAYQLLRRAVWYGRDDIVCYLLDLGNIHPDVHGGSALRLALGTLGFEHSEDKVAHMVYELLRRGADPLRHNLWSIRLCLQRNFFVVAALLCMYSAHRDHAAASKMHDLVHELYAQGSIEQAYLVKTAMNEAPAFFSLP